jgi:hypothetical protein
VAREKEAALEKVWSSFEGSQVNRTIRTTILGCMAAALAAVVLSACSDLPSCVPETVPASQVFGVSGARYTITFPQPIYARDEKVPARFPHESGCRGSFTGAGFRFHVLAPTAPSYFVIAYHCSTPAETAALLAKFEAIHGPENSAPPYGKAPSLVSGMKAHFTASVYFPLSGGPAWYHSLLLTSAHRLFNVVSFTLHKVHGTTYYEGFHPVVHPSTTSQLYRAIC